MDISHDAGLQNAAWAIHRHFDAANSPGPPAKAFTNPRTWTQRLRDRDNKFVELRQ
jgi:hypothetical protein